MGIQNPPRNLTLSYDTAQAKEKRSFGYFDPNDNKIWVYVGNRNMGDILRTLAHELVHRKQDEDGRISYESGKTGSDIEKEAICIGIFDIMLQIINNNVQPHIDRNMILNKMLESSIITNEQEENYVLS